MNPDPSSLNILLDRLEYDSTLSDPQNFIARVQALDALELQLLGDQSPLNNRLTTLKQHWATADETLFATLLNDIHTNHRNRVQDYFRQAQQQCTPNPHDDNLGYDELDLLTNGLLQIPTSPADPQPLADDLVFYQPTPTRVLLKLLDQLRPTPTDIFYDLGSGLGHVPLLVNLFTNLSTVGIEIESAYTHYAQACQKKLGLLNVTFLTADLRTVDLSSGTIFYLYTPVKGEALVQLLNRLHTQAQRHPIQICTYGPCTLPVSQQPWLTPSYQTGTGEGALAIFTTEPHR